MTVAADENGNVKGWFRIPLGHVGGIKEVTFQGPITRARGEILAETYINWLTEITQRTYTYLMSIGINRVVYTGLDPIAQTFTLESPCMLAGADVQFSAKGPSNVILELRETTVGFPNQTVLANAVITPDDVPAGNLVAGVWTRILFPNPAPVAAGREYAIVMLCDDAEWAVRIATLGEVDKATWTPITEQPYTVGVLLKSSNQTSWSIDQLSDLTFRLLEPVYETTSLTTSICTANVTSAEIMKISAFVSRPLPGTDVKFFVTTSATTYETYEETPFLVSSPGYTGVVTVTAAMYGTEFASPLIHKNVTIGHGHGLGSGTYITKAIPCASAGGTCRATFGMNAFDLGIASITVTAQTGVDGGGDPIWSDSFDVARDDSIGGGWKDRVYTHTGLTATETRFKVEMEGTVAEPALIRNVYAYTVEEI